MREVINVQVWKSGMPLHHHIDERFKIVAFVGAVECPHRYVFGFTAILHGDVPNRYSSPPSSANGSASKSRKISPAEGSGSLDRPRSDSRASNSCTGLEVVRYSF